jgi:hypothetical protein
MQGSNAFEYGRFQCGRFIELLPFKHAQGLTDHIAFVGITTGVNETVNKLVLFKEDRRLEDPRRKRRWLGAKRERLTIDECRLLIFDWEEGLGGALRRASS